MTMSEKDLRLAAETGKKVTSTEQNKIMEEALARTKARVAELNAMKEAEEAAKRAAELNANQPVMSRRQRALEAQGKSIEELVAEKKAKIEEEASNSWGIQPEVEEFQPKIEDLSATPVEEEIPTPKVIKQEENKVMTDLQNVKPKTNGATFRPFAHTQQKVKIDQVPSYGLSYPEGWEIYVTPYSGDDLDDLNNSSLTLKYILSKCMEGVYTNFDKNNITFYDALYLSYYRRVLSIGENKIQVLSKCPFCDKYSSKVVDINEEIEFEESKIPALPINVEFSFGTLSFSYLTYKNFMDLETDLKSEELAYQCVTECDIDVEAGETKEGELQKLFGSLVGEDAELLNSIRELTYHGIKPVTSICQNKACGRSYETLIDEMSALILPFRGSKKDSRSKISFG